VTEEWLLRPIEGEFEEAELGDERLKARLLVLAGGLSREPGASFARVSKSVAAREAAYRFLENQRVTMEALMQPHREATAQRCREVGAVYVVSDTTEVVLSGEKRGKALGRIQGRRRGFLAHTALAVSARGNRAPLGVLGIQTIVRDDERKKHRNVRQTKGSLDRESLRWSSLISQTEELLEGVEAIHVMDREADMFELLSELIRENRRFVIRASHDRVTGDGKLFQAVSAAPAVLERDVQLSPRAKRVPGKGRSQPARDKRTATLSISSKRLTLHRPKRLGEEFPDRLQVNLVHVFEAGPPDGNPPVQWLLATSEPVDTPEQIAAVVDAYRARWLIEEYFKALKTGCAYEDRQLRSVRTLTNALGLLVPIAWRLLLLRTLEREAPSTPAKAVFDPLVLDALALKLREIRDPNPLPPDPTVADFFRGIARLGGHHKSNGRPGWQLLWYGFQYLLSFAAGFIAGRSASSYDHS
jgi:Transposase DNA-binding/Transposase DDE domain